MKTAKRIVLSMVIVNLTFGSCLVSAQSSQGFSERSKEKRQKIESIMQELNLTPQQKAQIESQRNEQREQNKQLRTLLSEKRKELKQELEKAVSDRAQIERIAEELKEIQSQRLDQRINSILKMKEILTPEQYEKFRQKTRSLMKQKGKRMNAHRLFQGEQKEEEE